jgi:hypothetical protein
MTYAALATQIARISWGRSECDLDGTLRDVHFNENDLQAPCDMLARLGVLRDNVVSHSFPADWSPLDEARLVRHAGEPTEKDLLLGLMFYTEWFPSEAALSNRHPMAPAGVGRRDGACWKPIAGDLVWAVQGACELLLKLKAGSWQANGEFWPRSAYSDSYKIELYWSSRNEMIRCLGSEKLLYPPTHCPPKDLAGP